VNTTITDKAVALGIICTTFLALMALWAPRLTALDIHATRGGVVTAAQTAAATTAELEAGGCRIAPPRAVRSNGDRGPGYWL
jgi:hypothetical protein